jgi:very-short-patch-repair endonuclease
VAVDVLAVFAECARDQQGLATSRQLRAAGLSTGTLDRAISAGVLRRVRRAVYSADPLPARPRYLVDGDGVAAAHVLRVRSVLLSLGDTVTACGRTAAVLRGWGLLVEPAKVEVAVRNGRDEVDTDGVLVTQRRRLDRERLEVLGAAGLWVTTALQTAVDALVTLPVLDAVVLVDSALRSGEVRLEDLEGAAARLPGRREAARARRALGWCDPLSGSVLESVLRVRLRQADFDGFATQQVLHAACGKRILRVDFCWEEARLVVEVDGARWHQDLERDRTADNALAAAGWRVLRFGWAEVVHQPDAVLAMIREALGHSVVHLQSPEAREAA